eukprot:5079589-Pleurochrysis_carterae.AAC.2
MNSTHQRNQGGAISANQQQYQKSAFKVSGFQSSPLLSYKSLAFGSLMTLRDSAFCTVSQALLMYWVRIFRLSQCIYIRCVTCRCDLEYLYMIPPVGPER